MNLGEMKEEKNMWRVIKEVKNEEIYNIGEKRNVKVSFEKKEYKENEDEIGKMRMIE